MSSKHTQLYKGNKADCTNQGLLLFSNTFIWGYVNVYLNRQVENCTYSKRNCKLNCLLCYSFKVSTSIQQIDIMLHSIENNVAKSVFNLMPKSGLLVEYKFVEITNRTLNRV